MPDTAAAAKIPAAPRILDPAAKISIDQPPPPPSPSPSLQDEQEPQRRYSLIVRGLSKKLSSPDSLKRLADSILAERFQFFPRRDEFVDKVFYCLDVEGDMAILVFHSELESELLFNLCRDEAVSPFAIAGKRFELERFAYSPSEEFARIDADGDRDDVEAARFAYITRLPGKWEDPDRLRDYFDRLLERDLMIKVVRSIRLVPGAAYVEFKSKVAVGKLLSKCWADPRVAAGIDPELVICCGDRVLPLSKERLEKPELDQRDRVEAEMTKNDEDLLEVVGESGLGLEQREQAGELQNRAGSEKIKNAKIQTIKVANSPPMGKFRKKASVRFAEESPKSGKGIGTDLPKAAGNGTDLVRSKQIPGRQVGSPLAREVQNVQGRSRQDQSGARKNLPEIQQVSVMLGGFKSLPDVQRLSKVFISLFRKHKNYTCEAELKWRIEWDGIADGIRMILSSEDMANRLMEMFVRAPEEFSFDKMKFWMFRPQGHRRRRAVYRSTAFSSDLKVLLFSGNGIRVNASAHRQFRAALTEALDQLLCDAGVLEEGKSLLKDLHFRDEGIYGVVEEQVAKSLMRAPIRLFVAGNVVTISEPVSQRTIFIVNLPSETGSYDLVKLRQVLRSGMKKLKPDESVADCIAYLSWLPTQPKGQVILQSDAAADALMAAYVRYTLDFCLPELPMSLHRSRAHIAPGIVFRAKDVAVSNKCALNLTGFPPSLDSKVLSGAVCELIVRAVLRDGVLEENERTVKQFFWRNGTRVARVTVDEIVAEKLVLATGLILAECPVTFFRDGGGGGGREATTRTGGWIDDDEEGEMS